MYLLDSQHLTLIGEMLIQDHKIYFFYRYIAKAPRLSELSRKLVYIHWFFFFPANFKIACFDWQTRLEKNTYSIEHFSPEVTTQIRSSVQTHCLNLFNLQQKFSQQPRKLMYFFQVFLQLHDSSNKFQRTRPCIAKYLCFIVLYITQTPVWRNIQIIIARIPLSIDSCVCHCWAVVRSGLLSMGRQQRTGIFKHSRDGVSESTAIRDSGQDSAVMTSSQPVAAQPEPP